MSAAHANPTAAPVQRPPAAAAANPAANDDTYENLSANNDWIIPVGDLQAFINTKKSVIDKQFEVKAQRKFMHCIFTPLSIL